ncbi:hypothetical protein ILUMI_14649, partial [Ignelater luminosus]
LCEAKTGYVWKIIVYTGKETKLKDFVQGIDTKSLTKPTQIVLTLAEEILNKGHLIAMDNYYSFPELYDLLCQLKTDAIGTVRVNRKQLPKSVTQKKLQRGETVGAFKEKLMCLKWHDKKDITMMSTIHSNYMIEMQTKRGDVKHKPLVIIDYNTGMGGVDLSDQYLITLNVGSDSTQLDATVLAIPGDKIALINPVRPPLLDGNFYRLGLTI